MRTVVSTRALRALPQPVPVSVAGKIVAEVGAEVLAATGVLSAVPWVEGGMVAVLVLVLA